MIKEIKDKNHMNELKKLFKNIQETMINSCVDGYMGNAWADSDIKCGQIVVGDFCFFAGESVNDAAEELVKNIPESFPSDEILMIPEDDQWAEIIEKVYKDKYKKYNRYAVKKNNEFDIDKLKKFENKLSENYCYKKIDKEIYEKYKNESWFKDFCSQFDGYNDYEKRGLGFVIVKKENNETVCGASSYTIFKNGIEIQIETKEGYKRQGFATMCGAKIILECLKKNIYPSWDANNKESLILAQKLGYTFDREYVTYLVKA